MKHVTAFLAVALLLIVGTMSANAQVQNYNISTQNLGFGGTTVSPSPSQSYYIQWLGPNTGTVTINVYNSVPYIKISKDNVNFSSSLPAFQMTPGAWAFIYVRVEASAPMTLGGFGSSDCVSNHIVYFEPALNTTLSSYNFVWLNGNIPLPIQLSSFKATTLTGNGVTLTWNTVSETNNYGFYVQRNGVDISFIAGHGTTLQSHTYSYTDNPSSGKYQYRLKQVDLDGTATLSEAILMDVAAPAKFALYQNYPNPFNPSTQITFSITKEGPVSLRVYDILGREVATLVNENRKAGQYTERFDGSRVASGVYMYMLQSGDGRLTSRMILSK